MNSNDDIVYIMLENGNVFRTTNLHDDVPDWEPVANTEGLDFVKTLIVGTDWMNELHNLTVIHLWSRENG